MDKIKEEKYDMLYRQIASLIDGESNSTGILANVSAAIHTTMDFWWTGFYLVSNGELQLGPFQGPVACMHIQYGRGYAERHGKKSKPLSSATWSSSGTHSMQFAVALGDSSAYI